jgi:two-component system, OmpR family, response regulator ResD
MERKKIMIVDDEPLIRKLVTDFLKKQGYTPIEAEDGQQALDKFELEDDISLILLDVMLPVFDGWTVCREIRKKSKVPIIMLTARGAEFDEVFGFEIGADEYITKPFSLNILIARINALFRRVEISGVEIKTIGGVVLDEIAHTVCVDGREIDLTPNEYELLNYLMENTGKVLSREQILDKVWGFDYFGDFRTVDTHINRLRLKLDSKSNYVQTVRGYGYRFEVGE